MLVTVALLLLSLALPVGQQRDTQNDVVMALRMRQREEFLQQQMARLQQSIEQNRHVKEATLLSAVLEPMFYTLLGGLVVLPPFWWLAARKMNLGSDWCDEQDRSGSKEEDEEEEEEQNKEEEELYSEPSGVSPLPVFTPLPTQDLPDTCKTLKELVGELLDLCQTVCKNNFLPQMHPAIGRDGPCEDWSIKENSIAYRLLVCLQPPPGHSFIPELDTTGQMPARPSRIRVALECICWKEKLLGENLCFLHHSNDKMPRDQSSLVLRTLCTDSCLDLEKVTSCFQVLVMSAWLLLPESRHCKLTALPSSQSCRFQLSGSSETDICFEIVFAMEPAAEVPT